MKTRKILSLLLAMTMILSTMAFPAFAADGHCDDEANCLVCNVADLINSLPQKDEITVENAAAVTNQIHAIDRIKYDLSDEQYDELLTLVDTGADESGEGLDVPVRYMEAVEAINELGGGGWFSVEKKFVGPSGSEIDVTDAEVKFNITNVATGATTPLTLATLGTQTSALGTEYYTENADGWTYKYMLPAGTYKIEEVSDSGATIDGAPFVTGSVAYNGVTAESTEITVAVGETTVVMIYNTPPANAIHSNIEGEGTLDFSTDDVEITDTENVEYLTNVKITATPGEGYSLKTLTVINEATSDEITLDEENCFIMPVGAVTVNATFTAQEGHSSHPVCGDADCTDHGDELEWQVFDGTNLNLTSGNWYLAEDVELPSTLYIGQSANACTVRLCLNGHKLSLEEGVAGSVIEIYNYYMVNTTTNINNSNNTLELCDCNGDNGIWKFTDNNGLWQLSDDGEYTVEGGIITGLSSTSHSSQSAVLISSSATQMANGYKGSVFNMYSGNIVGNNSHGVHCTYYGAKFNMYGGRIAGNSASGVYIGTRSTVNISGAMIDHNSTTSSGGGIYAYDQGYGTSVNISDTTIEYNTAKSHGGGVYLSGEKGVINMSGTTVQYNTANKSGGGICVEGPSYSGTTTFNINEGTLIQNNSAKNGGGASVIGDTYEGGTLNMNAGSITNNEAETYGGGVYVYTDDSADISATFNMTNANALIKNNKATYGGGIYCDEYSTLKFTGGTVQSNNASIECGGVYAINGCSVSGKVTITDNTVGSGENSSSSNVCGVDASDLITVGELDNTSAIGVSAPSSQQPGTSVQFTSGGVDYIDLFSCDTENTLVEKTTDGANLQFRMLDVNERTITVAENIQNGNISVDKNIAHGGDTVTVTTIANENYVIDKVTVTTADGSTVDAVADAEDETKFTFTMPADNVTVSATFKDKTFKVNIASNLIGGSVTADKTEAKLNEDVTLTVQPTLGYSYVADSLTVTDADGNEIEATEAVALFALDAPTTLTFAMPASEVTVTAAFEMKEIADIYTVEAVVDETVTIDKRVTTEGMDVYAGDTVKVDVVVNGADYTNADWTLVYDYGKFEFDHYEINTNYATTGYITHDETNASKGVIIGYARGVAGETAGDEFVDGEAIVSYYFKAIPQIKEVTGKFNITQAHVNNYEMAGIQDNTAATSGAVDVTIILITDDDDDDATTPAGSIEPATKEYNALEQSGNEYVLDEEFEEATVTYAIVDENGSEVTDTNGDGSTADEIAALTYKTGLPTWKNVGTYTYYVKISGDGLATIYASTTLTITPATLTPSATFAVDPAVDKVTITPTLEGVLDGTHNGTVTLTYTDVNGEQEVTLNASEFAYDGESTSVYTGAPIEVTAKESGDFTVTLNYTEGEGDNYTGEENTATVNVDKLTADDETITALEDSITSVFPYDSTAHEVDVADITGVTPGEWRVDSITNAYDDSDNPTVTNVGDEELAKVVFVDDSGVYNDVVVYVVLKVTPAKVLLTIDDKSKAVGEADPEFTYTIQVVDEEGNVLVNDGLYSDDDLTALGLELTRTPGEAAGTYTITASYVPNANYEIEVVDGELTIGAPSTDGDDADVKIEVVDLSNVADGTPDYIADKRLVLVYTNLDKVYYGYGDADNYEKMFDVTAAGYKYVDNDYTTGTLVATEDTTEYAHVYGIVVDKLADFEATEEHEALYRNNVVFLGSEAAYAPANIVYDADINLTGELDVNDYSMNNGIYNVAYDRISYLKSILKADYDHNKVVDTTDSLEVKAVVDTAQVVTQ